MRERDKTASGWVQIVMCVFALATINIAVRAQVTPDLSGLWKQDNDRCQPPRRGDVILKIEQSSASLTVETSISHGGTSRHAMQKYTLDGIVSVSTGADGDEFHTGVVRKGVSLVFSIEEHEDGRILQATETWRLLEDGATLERIRERPDGEKQILIFRRQR